MVEFLAKSLNFKWYEENWTDFIRISIILYMQSLDDFDFTKNTNTKGSPQKDLK